MVLSPSCNSPYASHILVLTSDSHTFMDPKYIAVRKKVNRPTVALNPSDHAGENGGSGIQSTPE